MSLSSANGLKSRLATRLTKRKRLVLPLLALLPLLSACQTPIFGKFLGVTGAPESNASAHGREIAEIYCGGLKPTPLGQFIWQDDAGGKHIGMEAGAFDASPAPIRLWIIARFDQWSVMCDPESSKPTE